MNAPLVSAPRGGLGRAFLRELRRMASTPFYFVGMVIIPLVSAVLLIATFGSGVVRELPVAVVDGDGSPLSGRLIRMLDATAGLRVAFVERDERVGHHHILRGESYATIVIPHDLALDIARGRSPHVSVFFNNQFLVPASVVRRDAGAAIGTLSASVEAGRRAGRGELPTKIAATLEPVTVDVHTMGNTTLSYLPYLVAGLLPTLLQIFVIVTAVHAFGSELRDGTAGEMLSTAGDNAWAAIVGKTLPYAIYFLALSLGMMAVLFGRLGVPFDGHRWVVVGTTFLFVMAYLAMGFAMVALSGNLRLATSMAAFYSVPAFAFAGLTFPTFGMPVLGQAWSSLLPLSHYVEAFLDLTLRHAPLSAVEHPLVILLSFSVVPWILLGWRYTILARSPKTWGRT